MLRYVALGDSYTIGTAVAPSERFPDQLVAALPQDPPALRALEPDLVTVLIGVNDVVQRVPPATYEANVKAILDDLLRRLPPERIIAVAIPDFTVTLQGASYDDPGAQSAAIRANNATMARLAAERSIAWVDILDLSLRAATDRTLVADDGLHPSGAQ